MLELGLVHTPLTPFAGGMAVDLECYGRILDFHVRHGAEALALPMHVGESVSLSDAERRTLIEYAVEHVNGRVPVVAHVSQSGTDLACALATHAQEVGAAAIICTTPYYWKPQPDMMLQHFVSVGAAVTIPYFLYNAPGEMGGTRVTTELALKLLDRLDNFAGLVDVSLDWQFLIDVVSTARSRDADFQLLSGLEFLISAGAIGARGAFVPHAAIAPGLIRRLYDLCTAERYAEARAAQEDFARLYQRIKPYGVAGMKAAAEALGRACGDPRPPVLPLAETGRRRLTDAVLQLPFAASEAGAW